MRLVTEEAHSPSSADAAEAKTILHCFEGHLVVVYSAQDSLRDDPMAP
ncbi:MAG: hypothetical protein OXJ37_07675 [Bryobacterales bacterium]|nr:hypothetical protein [Bryobacterales bacterium]